MYTGLRYDLTKGFMEIKPYQILCLAKMEYEKARVLPDSWENHWKILLTSKRLEDALLYYEGKLKFKGTKI